MIMFRKREQKYRTSPGFLPPDVVCKICLENPSESRFICPCRCAGTVKYVHEDCLKTWILAKHKDLQDAKCELCSCSYNMNYKIGLVCAWKDVFSENAPRCIIGPLLMVIEVMIFLLIYLLLDKVQEKKSNRSVFFCSFLILVCAVSALVIGFLTVIVIKQVCFVKKLKNWEIYDQESQEERPIDHTVLLENSVFPDSFVVPDIINAGGVPVLVPENLQPNLQRRSSIVLRSLNSEGPMSPSHALRKTHSDIYSPIARKSIDGNN